MGKLEVPRTNLPCPAQQKVKADTIEALKWLGSREHPFIYWDDQSKTYQPTPFGKAVLASGLAPEVCLVLKVGLGVPGVVVVLPYNANAPLLRVHALLVAACSQAFGANVQWLTVGAPSNAMAVLSSEHVVLGSTHDPPLPSPLDDSSRLAG